MSSSVVTSDPKPLSWSTLVIIALCIVIAILLCMCLNDTSVVARLGTVQQWVSNAIQNEQDLHGRSGPIWHFMSMFCDQLNLNSEQRSVVYKHFHLISTSKGQHSRLYALDALLFLSVKTQTTRETLRELLYAYYQVPLRSQQTTSARSARKINFLAETTCTDNNDDRGLRKDLVQQLTALGIRSSALKALDTVWLQRLFEISSASTTTMTCPITLDTLRFEDGDVSALLTATRSAIAPEAPSVLTTTTAERRTTTHHIHMFRGSALRKWLESSSSHPLTTERLNDANVVHLC